MSRIFCAGDAGKAARGAEKFREADKQRRVTELLSARRRECSESRTKVPTAWTRSGASRIILCGRRRQSGARRRKVSGGGQEVARPEYFVREAPGTWREAQKSSGSRTRRGASRIFCARDAGNVARGAEKFREADKKQRVADILCARRRKCDARRRRVSRDAEKFRDAQKSFATRTRSGALRIFCAGSAGKGARRGH